MTEICIECGYAYTTITSASESAGCPACRSRQPPACDGTGSERRRGCPHGKDRADGGRELWRELLRISGCVDATPKGLIVAVLRGLVEAASADAEDRRAPCPTCDGEGVWLDADSPNPSAEMRHNECADCFGHGTLDAPALVAMVLELSAANGELHDALAGQQASHEAEIAELEAQASALEDEHE